MATIEKNIESVGMKITVNHGEREGKIVKSRKRWLKSHSDFNNGE